MNDTYQAGGPPTILLLCRHGQSEWNAAGRVQGQSLVAAGLTELGRWQAERLAARLAASPVDALYSSDLLRAVETAEIVAAPLGKTQTLEHAGASSIWASGTASPWPRSRRSSRRTGPPPASILTRPRWRRDVRHVPGTHATGCRRAACTPSRPDRRRCHPWRQRASLPS